MRPDEEADYFWTLGAFVDMIKSVGIEQVRHDLKKMGFEVNEVTDYGKILDDLYKLRKFRRL